MDTIHSIVRNAEQNYVNGNTRLGKYVSSWSMYDTIETIDAYLNSKHTSGSTDSLGREKPFFNIVTAATNIWYRATDLDRKNIRIMPDGSKSVVSAFLAQVVLQDWMDKNRFGKFLNLWGRALARYGSAVVKFVEKDGDLVPSVIPWNRFIADPVDFDAIPHIEKFYKTPAQLRKMTEYDQDVVDKLINSFGTRKTLDGQQKDNEGNFIEIYEVHGELPTYFLDEEPVKPDQEKDIKYRQQMHVISFVCNEQGEYEDFTLFKGKEAKDPYMITHLIPEDGRTLSIGAVEYLFDAQWMQNHSIKQWKDQVDLASKLIFQTADANFLGRNVLSAIENGDIMVHKENMPLTLINNQGHDITSIQSFMQMWRVNLQEQTSTPESLRGTTQPSGTAYRQVAILQQEANSLFEVMIENKALDLEDMLRVHVLPHVEKKLDNADEIVAILDEHNITQIDAMYIPNEAVRRFNKRSVDSMLNGGVVSPYMPEIEEAQVKKDLAPLGNMRPFKPSEVDGKTWKEVLKGFEWKIKIEITNENKDKQAVLASLTTLFQSLAQTDPEKGKLVMNKILNETGVVSPLELSMISASSPPVGGQVGAELNGLNKTQ